MTEFLNVLAQGALGVLCVVTVAACIGGLVSLAALVICQGNHNGR